MGELRKEASIALCEEVDWNLYSGDYMWKEVPEEHVDH